MNKNTWITLGLLAVVLVVFLLVRGGGDEVAPSFELSGVSDLERVEIMLPPGEDVPELIVVQRRGDGNWWLMRPEEALIDPDIGAWFGSVFAQPIGTDDIVIDAGRAASYDLAEDQAVQVALFSGGRDRPVHEFLVGREIEVEQTGARRTFFKMPGADVIYRGQQSFGHLLRLTPEEMRDRQIIDLRASAIDELIIDGDSSRHLVRHGDEWKHAPAKDEEFGENASKDRQSEVLQVPQMVETLAGLRARRWASGVSRQAAGLQEEPAATIEIVVGDRSTTLTIGNRVDQSSDRRYAEYSETEGIFELSSESAQRLVSPLGEEDR